MASISITPSPNTYKRQQTLSALTSSWSLWSSALPGTETQEIIVDISSPVVDPMRSDNVDLGVPIESEYIQLLAF